MVVAQPPKEVQGWVRPLAAPPHGRLAGRRKVLARGRPLRAPVYLRERGVAPLTKWSPNAKFGTKLAPAAALVRGAADRLPLTGQARRLVLAGADAERPFVKGVLAVGATRGSRRRQDAARRRRPQPPRPGPQPKYAKQALSRVRRAARARGRQAGEFDP